MIAEIAAGTPHYYVANHRGDTVAVITGTAGSQTVDRFWYDAFGNPVTVGTPTFTPRYSFSTKEYLADAQLYLYAYRVYDPVAGRWTQRDPIDYQDSVNLYQFCGNNPVNKTDAFGQDGVTIMGHTFTWGRSGWEAWRIKGEDAHEKQHRDDYKAGLVGIFTTKIPLWQLEQRAFEAEAKSLEASLKDPTLTPKEREKLKLWLSTVKTCATEEGARIYTNQPKTSQDVTCTPKQNEHSSKNPARMFVPNVVNEYTGKIINKRVK